MTTIAVERGWDDEQGEIGPKSAKGRRKVPVSGVLPRYLLEHKMRTGLDGDELLFGRGRRAALTPTHVRKQARRAWAAYAVGCFLQGRPGRLEPIGLHEARHTPTFR